MFQFLGLAIRPRYKQMIDTDSMASGTANCCVEKFWSLADFQKSGTFCDVTIRVGLAEERFRCHRNVLAAASPYFFAMFGGQMKESQADEVPVRIDGVSPEVEADIFCYIIDYMYSREDFQLTSTNVCNLVLAANFFRVCRHEQTENIWGRVGVRYF